MVSNDCDGMTKKETPCKNLGIYNTTDKHFCYWHVPRLESTCVICLCRLFGVPQLLECGHLFHPKCIRKWVRKKQCCPVCRQPVYNGSLVGKQCTS